MGWINDGFDWLGGIVAGVIPPGDLQDLIVRGGLAGVAAVVTFLPQILFLFLFLGFLEDSGYMARAAFIMDRVMGKVGLHGKSFIPLLSSFACAIPGIMATRTIDNPKDRLATMLVAPLMSCSARLPVYALLIAAFVPAGTVLGLFSYAGITLLSMYLLGLVAALTMAWVFKKTFLRGTPPAFLMELPPYKLPSMRSVLYQMWERASSFLKRAGTIILGASILLWFLASYPKLEHATRAQQLNYSFAGRAGHLIEPVIKPLGFDWKIGIGLVSSLLQREVFVSTMGTIYNIENPSGDEAGSLSLRRQMSRDRDPATGLPTFTLLTAICVMVYYVLAMQCLSTVAVMRRETNGWKWPLFQIGYMTVLAYIVTFAVYRAGLWLGIGG
jgi:ferrous iron transport protein B